MAGKSGKRRPPWSGVVIVVVLMLVPGGIMFAKGLIEVVDRFATRTVHEATLTGTELGFTITNGNDDELHYVDGEIAGGEAFRVDDERLYTIADGRTPLPVRVETSRFSERVLAVRSDFGNVDGVGGASSLPLGILALVLGAGLAVVPFMLARRSDGTTNEVGARVARRTDWGVLTAVSLSAVAIVGGTLAWDLLR